MVKINNKLAIVVLLGNIKIDFEKLKKAMDAKQVELVREYEFQEQFPGCELGAMPPFGNLFDMDVYVSDELKDEKEIAFNPGTHSQLVKLAWEHYEKLVNPKIISL